MCNVQYVCIILQAYTGSGVLSSQHINHRPLHQIQMLRVKEDIYKQETRLTSYWDYDIKQWSNFDGSRSKNNVMNLCFGFLWEGSNEGETQTRRLLREIGPPVAYKLYGQIMILIIINDPLFLSLLNEEGM